MAPEASRKISRGMLSWGAYLAYGCTDEISTAEERIPSSLLTNEDLFEKIERAFRSKLCLSRFSSRMAIEFLRSRLCLPDGQNRFKRVLGYVIDLLNNKNKKEATSVDSPVNWQSGCPNVIKGLRARPIWDNDDFPWIKTLEEHSSGICLELMALRGQQTFQPYRAPSSTHINTSSTGEDLKKTEALPSDSLGTVENLKKTEGLLSDSLGTLGTTVGDWNVCYLHLHGLDVGNSLQKCPITAAAIE